MSLKLILIHLEVQQLLKKQLEPSTNLHSWIVENPIHQVFQTHFPTPFHVFPTTLLLWGTNSSRKRLKHFHNCGSETRLQPDCACCEGSQENGIP